MENTTQKHAITINRQGKAENKQVYIFAMPPAVNTNTGYVGPNFQYTTPVSEPATIFLLGFGLIRLAGYARRVPSFLFPVTCDHMKM
jgi:hypothetical protein